MMTCRDQAQIAWDDFVEFVAEAIENQLDSNEKRFNVAANIISMIILGVNIFYYHDEQPRVTDTLAASAPSLLSVFLIAFKKTDIRKLIPQRYNGLAENPPVSQSDHLKEAIANREIAQLEEAITWGIIIQFGLVILNIIPFILGQLLEPSATLRMATFITNFFLAILQIKISNNDSEVVNEIEKVCQRVFQGPQPDMSIISAMADENTNRRNTTIQGIAHTARQGLGMLSIFARITPAENQENNNTPGMHP